MKKAEKVETALATRDDLPQYSREYYITIVRGYPERLEEILKGYGWNKEKLFSEGVKTFLDPKFAEMSPEEKAATLLWQMENRAKEEFRTTQATVRKLLEKFLPQTWVDAIFERFRQSG